MTTHTPAPWQVISDVPMAEIGYRAILAQDGETICNPSPMGGANARLIAAAPNLLAALRDLLRVDCMAEAGMYRADRSEVQDRARAAIAKAEGRA